MLLAGATTPPRDGLHTSHSAAWNAGTRQEHGEPLNLGFYSDNGGRGGGGSSQNTATTVAVPAAAAAVISGEPSEQRSLQESGRPSMASKSGAARVDMDKSHRRLRHGRSDDGNDRERHELEAETGTETYERATTEQSPGVTVDTKDEEELQSSETSTSHTPLVPSFCPAEAFERYASLHVAITVGKATQRSGEEGWS